MMTWTARQVGNRAEWHPIRDPAHCSHPRGMYALVDVDRVQRVCRFSGLPAAGVEPRCAALVWGVVSRNDRGATACATVEAPRTFQERPARIDRSGTGADGTGGPPQLRAGPGGGTTSQRSACTPGQLAAREKCGPWR